MVIGRIPLFKLIQLAIIFIVLALVASAGSAETRHADKIVIEKAARTLTLLQQGKVIATYHISLGSEPKGAKVKQGDGRTPEGMYTVDGRNESSRFYRSLHISYPNTEDRRRAERLGVSPGGDIMIHGIRNGFGWLGATHRLMDWTEGCIAVTNGEMNEIWAMVPNGTSVEIKP